jgi:putative aldouronate transport system permease protein
MKIKKSRDEIIFNAIAYPLLTLLAIACLIPFWLIVSAAFTDNDAILIEGYKLLPSQWSMTAFRYIFAAPAAIGKAYAVTIGITVVGTSVGLLLITMAGYVLNRKDFAYRNYLSFYIYFTTLFSGGMIPSYILMVQGLKLQNNYLSVILSGLMSPFLIILMRNFMKSIPDALVEAAKIDGAGDFRIFFSIIIHLAGPGIATVGLFLALGYWNNWYTPMLYLTKPAMYPLQYYLYNILTAQQSAQASGVAIEGVDRFPGESIKMAMAVVATGPILLLYPYVQKYFVRGITIGAVKG